MADRRIPIGFSTMPLKSMNLEDVAVWGGKNGLDFINVAAGPVNKEGYEAPPGCPAHLGDLDDYTQERADAMKGVVSKAGIKMNSLLFYGNVIPLPNYRFDTPEIMEFNLRHLKKVIDAAQKLGVGVVGTNPGRESAMGHFLGEYRRVFVDVVKYASDRGVKIMIRDDPCDGYVQVRGGRSAINCSFPLAWRSMLEATPDVGIDLDPSLLLSAGVDPLQAVIDFGDHIVHAEGNDVGIKEPCDSYGRPEERFTSRLGAFHPRYVSLGEGLVDWRNLTPLLGDVCHPRLNGIGIDVSQSPDYSTVSPQRSIMKAKIRLDYFTHGK